MSIELRAAMPISPPNQLFKSGIHLITWKSTQLLLSPGHRPLLKVALPEIVHRLDRLDFDLCSSFLFSRQQTAL